MPTSEKIKKYLLEKGQVSGSELSDFLDLTDRAIRKQLSSLLKKGAVGKIGTPPKVFYYLTEKGVLKPSSKEIDPIITKFINENYLFISPTGESLTGMSGFEYWCNKIKLPLEKTALDYFKTITKYNKLKKDGLLSGMAKLKNTFAKINLDKLFYLDFYSIDRFGKTKLGQTLLYAKQSQDRKLMKDLINDIEPKIKKIVSKYNIESIGFIPPTVKRQVQFMRVLEKNLKLKLHKISIVKAKTRIAIPQKTLSKLEDRIENAKKTIIVDERKVHKNILLIDDAVGSGATLNETANQIKLKGICTGQIIGLAITGSIKGFDVISEV